MSTSQYTSKDIARFWSKADQSGGDNACWNWTAARTPLGYGVVEFEGRTQFAHRIAYQLTHDTVLGRLCILHRCDNPSCVNPAHLSAGTRAENTADMLQKGRASAGERNPAAKLTRAQVDEMRLRYAEGGITQTALANEYGISQNRAWKILHNKAWRG